MLISPPRSARREGAVDFSGCAASVISTYVFATLNDTGQATELIAMWRDFALAGRALFTAFAWPMLAYALCRLGRQSELLDLTSDIRIRTPWVESAEKIASGNSAAATRILATLGAGRLTVLGTMSSPAN